MATCFRPNSAAGEFACAIDSDLRAGDDLLFCCGSLWRAVTLGRRPLSRRLQHEIRRFEPQARKVDTLDKEITETRNVRSCSTSFAAAPSTTWMR